MDGLASNDELFLSKVEQDIQDNLGNDQYSVEQLAKNVGLSRSMLHRRLVKLTGKSATEFITESRLSNAVELLKNDNATVSEIAYKVGFKTPSYFNKVFKKHYNISPGEARKSNSFDAAKRSILLKAKAQLTALANKLHIYKLITVVFLIVAVISFGLYQYILKATPPERSIAVLPLNNLTGMADTDYFVDGMHDALIGELGQIASVRVISRTSTLRFRNSGKLLKDIADELGVNSIVEGSVIGFGDSIRILIQLIDVYPKERHLLANEYNDGLSNILTVQSSVVKDIAKKIDLRLSKNEKQLLTRARTVDPETYKAYLRGMYQLNQGTRESFEKGIAYLHQAIDRDPGDPFAYAGMALGYSIMGHGQLNSEEAFLLALSSAEKAIKLDPTIDEAYNALSILYLYSSWDWPKAKQAFENTLKNNPNNAIAHAHFAWYHVLFHDMEKTLYHAEQAAMIEPFSASYSAWMGLLLCLNKEYDKAEGWAKKALKLNENIPYGNLVLGWVCIHHEKFEEAIKYHERLPAEGAYFSLMRGYAYLKAGKREKAMELWNELEELSEKGDVNPCYRGLMAAYLGFTDLAFELLNKAVEQKSYPITYINFYPYAEDIRLDPRYAQLLQRMNLPANKVLVTSK